MCTKALPSELDKNAVSKDLKTFRCACYVPGFIPEELGVAAPEIFWYIFCVLYLFL